MKSLARVIAHQIHSLLTRYDFCHSCIVMLPLIDCPWRLWQVAQYAYLKCLSMIFSLTLLTSSLSLMSCIVIILPSTFVINHLIFTLNFPSSSSFLYSLHISISPTSYLSFLSSLLLTSADTAWHLIFVYAMLFSLVITSLVILKCLSIHSSTSIFLTHQSWYISSSFFLFLSPSSVSLSPTLLHIFKKILCLKIMSIQLSTYSSTFWQLVYGSMLGSCLTSPAPMMMRLGLFSQNALI